MTDVIIYLLKVIAIQGVLFLFYWLFLKNSLRHQLNRLFLLSSLCLAFIIPLVELPQADHIPIVSQNDLVVTWLSEPAVDYEVVIAPIIHQESEGTSFWFILPWMYVGITVFFLTRSIMSLAIIQRLKSHSVAIKKYWFKLFKTSHSRPFSFFSNVFIPESLFDSDDFDQVLAHECVHVKQRHSVDRLLLDFVVSLFWFNPFMYLYRNALIEIHEYQADEAVVNRFKDPIRYQEILFSQLQTPQYSSMVSHFNVSTIKKRIVMMNKKQNKKSGWIYLVILPLTLAMLFAFSSKEVVAPVKKVGTEISNIIRPEYGQFFPEISSQEQYTPSILPLKESGTFRVASRFGKRIHPIYKVEKMHQGLDFSCQMGTEVIATADGIVEKIETSYSGYGKMITINHDNRHKTRYAQLSEFSVKKGDVVKKGQLIALSGNSGGSTGPHLHYEVIEIGKGPVDPQPFIGNYEFKVKDKSDQGFDSAKEKNKNKNKLKDKSKDKKQTYKVIIDPGHGGEDSGELYADNRSEKEFVLSIAEHVMNLFESNDGIEIILTRDTDKNVTYSDRKKNSEGADLFISLHSKQYPDFLNGTATLMYSLQNMYFDKSEEIAEIIHHEFSSINDGECSKASFSNDGDYENEYELVENAKIPALLLHFDIEKSIELGISEENIAEKLVNGIKLAAL